VLARRGDRRGGKAHRVLAVDLVVLVLADVPDLALDDVSDGLDGIRLPDADGPRAVLVRDGAVKSGSLWEIQICGSAPELLGVRDGVDGDDVNRVLLSSAPGRSRCSIADATPMRSRASTARSYR
jgi:hypothetical protein